MTYLQQLNEVNQELYKLGKEIQDKQTELYILKGKREEKIAEHNKLVEEIVKEGEAE